MAVKPDEVLERRGVFEDFKLIHRALDVKKRHAEVRHAELENVRRAARVLKGNEEDPDIDLKIVIEGAAAVRGDTDHG